LSRSWKRNITNANFNHNLNNHHRSMIVQPDPNDVLLGRGKSHNTWPGKCACVCVCVFPFFSLGSSDTTMECSIYFFLILVPVCACMDGRLWMILSV
jgi:hypothetical protein